MIRPPRPASHDPLPTTRFPRPASHDPLSPLNTSNPIDAGSLIVMIVMGVVIMTPTVVIVAMIIAGRFRDRNDDP